MPSLNRFRSVSYPPKSNPMIPKMEEELIKLREAEAEASSTSATETICIGLSGLTRLYRCFDDMLTMPLLSQPTLSLSLSKHGNFFIQASSKLLDICFSSHHILQKFLYECCFDNSETQISSYFSFRKEMIQAAKALALQLRQVEKSSLMVSENEEGIINEDFEVIRVLRCVSIINISVLESLLRFMASSTKIKSGKFGLFSKWVIKKSNKSVIKEDHLPQTGNELSNVDVLLHGLDVERFEDNEFAKKRMEVLEVALRRIDDGLNNLVKQLKSTRASILNIISV